MKKLIWHFEDQNLTGNVLKLSESNIYDEADQMKTSSQKLGRHVSCQVRLVRKSLGRVSFGSKKFGPKMSLSIFSLNWTILSSAMQFNANVCNCSYGRTNKQLYMNLKKRKGEGRGYFELNSFHFHGWFV